MKTIAMIAAATVLTTSVANAGSWIKNERPCGSKCAVPTQAAVNGLRFRDPPAEMPTYTSRSRTVIQSSYGTTVINGTYRFYHR